MNSKTKDPLETKEGRAELRGKVQAELVGNALKLSGLQERRHKLLTLLALLDSLDADYAARDAANTVH